MTTGLEKVVKAAHRAGRRRWTGRAAAVLALAMLPSLLTQAEFQAEAQDKPLGRPELPAPREADLSTSKPKPDKKSAAALKKAEAADKAAAQRARNEQSADPVWPEPGTVTVKVPATGVARAKAGSLPVSIAAPKSKRSGVADEVTVTVLGRKAARAAGVDGVLLTVRGNEKGGARLAVNYDKFAVGGGDFGGRLRLVQLPSCVLTSPDKRTCRAQKELPSVNNRRETRVTGDVSLPQSAAEVSRTDRSASPTTSRTSQATVLAVTAGAASGLGNYKATPLSASSTWEAGGSSGSFTWSYPWVSPPRRLDRSRTSPSRTTRAASTGAPRTPTIRDRWWEKGST